MGPVINRQDRSSSGQRERAAVLGAGSWGTALAILLAKKGLPVRMWSIEGEVVREINEEKTNTSYLPGVVVPENISVSGSIEETLRDATVLVMSVPSHVFREVLKKTLPYLNRSHLVVNAAKGLEESSLKRLSEVFSEEAGGERYNNFVALSGPSHAEEVSREIPTAVVAAGAKRASCERLQDIFMCPSFRVYTNPDIVGVELSGALKNVIAICTGVTDGLGLGDNTKAALMTRGLAEISRLGTALGANPLTFAGLAGVGDLIVTCTSMHSRNRRFGIEVGKGSSVEEALKKVRMVVEGYRTTGAAFRLAQKTGITMPIVEQAYRVLYEAGNTVEAVTSLMTRGKKHEMEEVVETAYPDW
ncbi:MAG: NAD(P)H-dependent glycerol-3-phosphate dehydrogenase [Firmicutes bacterium HGW-Firmicutes-14]|nr:MAG: NAD(P)H-dependent glycerol-3-phosphate dehydrogenase [Firmicutes bacterium HGW-Firmicutes-14]